LLNYSKFYFQYSISNQGVVLWMPNDLDRDLDRESEAGWSDQGDEEHEEPSASGSAAIPVQQPQQVILF
tara:strand:- start:261 stop:467 length:207 start_codon:yes stop_codon:yes gene_type:complete